MGLIRTVQTGLKKETTEGTPETLAAIDFAGNWGPSTHTNTPGEAERNVARGGTLSGLGVMKGTKLLSLSGECECLGGGAAAEAPFHRVLEACGYKKTGVKKVEVTGVTNGPFRPGDRIGNNATEGSATKTGTVVEQYATADAVVLYYMPGTGTFTNSDTVYAYRASGAQPSATADTSPADGGHAFRPWSQTAAGGPPSFTFERRINGEVHRGTAGRGTGKLMFEVGAAPKLSFELTGCPVLQATDDPVEAAAVANVPAITLAPISCLHAPLRVGTLADLIVTKVEVDLGNTVTPRATITDSEFAASGHRGVRITDRRVVVTLDPEYVEGANALAVVRRTYKFETFSLSAFWGDPATTGRLGFFGLKGQLQGDFTPGDRNGLETAEMGVAMLGDADDEITLGHLF